MTIELTVDRSPYGRPSLRWLRHGCTVAVAWSLLCCTGDKKASDAVATVNGEQIDKAQFEAYLKLKRQDGAKGSVRDKLLEDYLRREGLSSIILKEKLLDAVALEAEVREFRKQAVIRRYFDELLRKKVTDKAVRSFYDAHGKDYEQRKVHVAHILVRTNRKMDEVERKAKLTVAMEALSKVRGGQPFDAIAEAYSEDKTSAKKGGDLGWISEGAVDPRFSTKVFSLPVGEASDPFESAFGFHIAKVLDAPQTLRQPFEAVSGDIRYQLRDEARRAESKRLLATTKVDKHQAADTKRGTVSTAASASSDNAAAPTKGGAHP